MQEVPPALEPGTLVKARGERWHVRDARHLVHLACVVLDAAEATNPQQSITLLLPFDELVPAAEGPPRPRRRQLALRQTLQALSEARPEGRLWTARNARLDLLPWQLAPALAVLQGATRVLLADAVGLGKTIQAGLILAELRARGLVERALILSPAALRRDWAAELGTRFGLPVAVLDLPAMLELERTRGVGMNPWSSAPVIVSSVDLVKRADVLLAVERAPLDLLVVDEVHHATPGTDRFAAVSRLARQVPWVVLASATPHSGDPAAYRALTALGAVGALPGDRLRVFRRSHSDVRFAVVRRTRILKVRSSAEEQRLLDGVLAYARELCRPPAGGTEGMRLLAGVLARRATSSPYAIQRTLRRRLDGLSSGTPPPAPASLPLPWEELDEDAGESWPSVTGFADASAERECLRDLVRLAEAAGPEWSKGRRLLRLVRAAGEPIIVFTEFRDSLEACRVVLEPWTPLVCLHGGIDAPERRARVEMFIDGRARVLLATDVAGEGLNLQGPSRLVVTLEWPWNPLRLEQRVGRVHRLGQTRAVHAIYLTAAQSYEDTVVARALERAGRAAADLSSAAGPVEASVAADVLGLGAATSAPDPAGSPPPRPDAPAWDEASRLDQLRRWARLGSPGRGRSCVWARPRRGPGATRLVAIVEVRRTAAGAPRSLHVVPIDITLHVAPADRRQWRIVCRRVADDPRVRQAAIEATGEVPSIDPWTGVRARLTAIREARRALSPRAVQPSLFDRRAVRDARGLEAVAVEWEARQTELERRLAAVSTAVTTRVVALVPFGGAPR